MDELFSVFKEFLPAITAGGTVVTAIGLIPRIGPERAVWIALRSRFAFKPNPESLRLAEIKLLRTTVADKDIGQSYLVVIGEKGVGKTCLLNTVTSKTAGVIKLEAQPRHCEDTIIENTLQELANPFKFMNPHDYARLTGAVRTLVERYKLRVVVHGSPNSIDVTLLRTKRQFEIKPMTKEMIWQIGQLQELFKYTKEAGLDDIVFAVLGGIPSRYEELWRNSKIDLQAGRDPREVIGSRLCAAISAAIKLVEDSCEKNSEMEKIINLLDKNTNSIRRMSLTQNKLQQPTPDKIFREVELDGISVLIPASNAIGIVLQHNITEEPSLDELESLCHNWLS